MAPSLNLPSHFQDWNASQRSVAKMEEKPGRKASIFKRPLILGIAIAVIVAVIIAVVVPLAVILPKRGKNHSATILLPLYIYPENKTSWDPLYTALDAHPNLKMKVIINPSSGPGEKDSPDENYARELQRLNTYPNVHMVGYVRTGYASRNLSDVLSEVSTFAGWASKNESYAMEGIFFDESPHEYSADAVEFMLSATKAVKNENGIQGEKTIIRNPGVIPDTRYNDTNTDITVVFEQNYPEYQSKQSSLDALPTRRSEYCYMMNSVPVQSKDKLRSFVDELSKKAEFLFLTNNDASFYESFGSDWADFTDVVPS